ACDEKSRAPADAGEDQLSFGSGSVIRGRPLDVRIAVANGPPDIITLGRGCARRRPPRPCDDNAEGQPRIPSMILRAKQMQDAADRLDVRVQSIGVHDVIDLDPAFTAISGGRAAALFTMVDPFTLAHRKRIVEFAAQHRLPAIYESREFVVSGGLVSYGPSNMAMQRRVVVYLDKVFKGTKPSDLPVEQPTKFELVINL